MSTIPRFYLAALLVISCSAALSTCAEEGKEKEKTADANGPDIKGEKATVTGEVIDVWCYMEGGDHGAEHKDCATACAKSGNPIGILDKDGKVLIVMGGQKDHQTAKELFADKMSKTVTVEGTLVDKGGTKVLFVKSVK